MFSEDECEPVLSNECMHGTETQPPSVTKVSRDKERLTARMPLSQLQKLNVRNFHMLTDFRHCCAACAAKHFDTELPNH